MPDQIEKILSRLTNLDNLRMWGQLYVSKTGQTAGGWLVDSWSENGAPYWHPNMHWLDKKESKLYHVQLDIGFGHGSMNIHGEDTEIDPERANFIRTTVAQWEKEWLEDEAKKL
jgi:tRNA(Ile)-lysidine synthase TilS/MesJ